MSTWFYPPSPDLPPAEYDAALDEYQRRRDDMRESAPNGRDEEVDDE